MILSLSIYLSSVFSIFNKAPLSFFLKVFFDMFFKLFGISFHMFAPTRENAFFCISSLDFFMKLMNLYNSDVNLVSLKTSSKYLSVHFFRLCRTLSLRRIHNTINLMEIL